METNSRVKKQRNKKAKAPLVVTVKTTRGNIVSMKQITPQEAKALRNPAYQYLA